MNVRGGESEGAVFNGVSRLRGNASCALLVRAVIPSARQRRGRMSTSMGLPGGETSVSITELRPLEGQITLFELISFVVRQRQHHYKTLIVFIFISH